MTFARALEIANAVIVAYREDAMQQQHAHGDSWTKVQNDWQGWDSQVRVLDREMFFAEHGHITPIEDAPEDFVAAIGVDGYWDFFTTDATEVEVRAAVVNCLPDFGPEE